MMPITRSASGIADSVTAAPTSSAASTPRRMSTMLCVICATSGSSPIRSPHCGRPTRMIVPFPNRLRRQRRERLGRRLALGLGAGALLVGRLLAERGQHAGALVVGPRGGLLEDVEAVEAAVRAGQQRLLRALVEHGQRHGGRAAAHAAPGARRTGRWASAASGAAAACASTLTERGAACRCRTRPAGRRRARSGAGGAPGARGIQRSGPASRTPSRSLARGSRGAVERQREVAGQVVAQVVAVEVDEQRRDLVGEPGRAAGRGRPASTRGWSTGPRFSSVFGQAVAVVVDLVGAEPGDRGHDDEDPARARWDCTRNGTRAVSRPVAQLEQVDAGDAVRRAHDERRAGLGRAALDGPRGADAPHAPAVVAPARVDEELDALAGAHRVVGRLRRERADREAGLPRDLAGLRRQRRPTAPTLPARSVTEATTM